ncbi:hypothetical protein NUW54_g488 [Trametes sanguinea]|uniref:Uncharacterized protein n=1 Tax=Trametes sanguinea TaxID=158606 RepID=A0ACC1QAI4_9APHY|nr:hypothetical protein NUW54_g488 [Trametes sanguinea]
MRTSYYRTPGALQHHDAAQNALTAFMCLGITISYLPQHWRIISAKSSEGFRAPTAFVPVSLDTPDACKLASSCNGESSSVAAYSAGSCLESIAGVLQLSLVWVLFVMILVLYMIYYPPHLKYVELDVNVSNDLPPQHIKTPVKREQWKLSIVLSWAVFLHMYVLPSLAPWTDSHAPFVDMLR